MKRPERSMLPSGPVTRRGLAGGLSGLIAAGLALGVAELVAGAFGRAVSPAIVVGGAAIDRTPRALKEFAIRTFGENDKIVLLSGVFATIAALAFLIGVLATFRRRSGLAAVSLLGLVAAVAALTRPTARWYDVLPSLLAAVIGVVTLAALVPKAHIDGVVKADRAENDADEADDTDDADDTGAGNAGAAGTRRRPVLLGGAATGLAIATGFGGRALLNARTNVTASRRKLVLPKPAQPAPALPQGAELDITGISPYFTPSKDFYRVDTALSVPRLTTQEWQLKIHGMVDREITLSFDDLLKRDIVENDITLTCVSNEVGGPLMGTSKWLGVELAPLLAEAGIKPGSDQLVSTSSDGMTIGTPVSVVTDGRNAMLAIAMNGEALLPEHGFPVRMIVPGLYGYVSATKWLVDLELSTFNAFDPYWVRRGWKQQAPIKTSSRIDTPKPLSRRKSGKIAVAGVAWAQHRGIERVEVRVDGGAWQTADLSTDVSKDLWRQWVWQWDATPGSHTLQVRATDGDGQTQGQDRVPPFPNGSTGWHSVVVTID